MHELGITQEIVEIVTSRCRGVKIARVVVEIGKLSAVLPEAVQFCFELCAEGTLAEGARLEIVQIAGEGRCRECGARVVLERPLGRCECGNTDLEFVAGDELRIREMELI